MTAYKLRNHIVWFVYNKIAVVRMTHLKLEKYPTKVEHTNK